MRLLLGGYTADMGGEARGIGLIHADDPDAATAGGQLALRPEVVAASSPSWVARHPTLDVIYAALEYRGVVQAYRRTGPDAWTPLGAAVPAGEAVCHVAVAPDGGSLVASCWSDGRVVRMRLDAAGAISAPVIAPAAIDPYGPDAADPAVSAASASAGDIDLAAAARALREAAGPEFAHLVPGYDEPVPAAPPTQSDADPATRPSRAHQARYLPRGLIVTTDMGLDLVRFWRDSAAGLRPVQEVALPLGSGPRHTLWHPSGHLYVLTELSREVFVLGADREGTWRMLSATPLAGVLADDTAAEIAMTPDGETVYAGVRGSDTLGVLRVRDAGDRLQQLALVDAGVRWPRHHVVVRDTLLVAGQLSDEVVSMTRDPRTGVPGRPRHRVTAPSPTCVLPLP
ncbi:lactonase family protein [Microbacterium thalli]|uniref:Beta-propeller fold lactonase family protein n=1 Tax=Microbacterium thalli TaxID=3027921 RepID=A0ABT5SDU6_9MICO|nr:beta-propeller fold lactonase family protein [Microbacterium thalli]MDD7960953.1 beta-propeller fold lactonase family protein [Microbacterium thalli]MDN8549788.1 beta-propeller fold lactonase family protein [Microbacterium thalli]